MNAEIIAVGTELLLGDIVNTNAQYLSRELAELGIGCHYQMTVGDNKSRLKKAVMQALQRSNIVIFTGGLGPTEDDLTKETVCETISVPLKLHEESLKRIEDYFKRSGRVMTEANKKQAMLPVGCTVFENDNGTAPGCAIEQGNQCIIMLPGPPREMVLMFESKVKPFLKKYSDGIILSTNVRVMGIGESSLEPKVKDLLDGSNPTAALYAKEGEVLIRVSAFQQSERAAKDAIVPILAELKKRLGEDIYGVNKDSIQQVVVELLKRHRLKIATAESCTAGLVSKMITEEPGSSEVFEMGVSAYSGRIKTEVLGVDAGLIAQKGEVSPEVAAAMAEGILQKSGADLGIGITGLAGPGGGTEQKPVGLVYVAVCDKKRCYVRKLMLGHNIGEERENIRLLSAKNALDMTRRYLEHYPDKLDTLAIGDEEAPPQMPGASEAGGKSGRRSHGILGASAKPNLRAKFNPEEHGMGFKQEEGESPKALAQVPAEPEVLPEEELPAEEKPLESAEPGAEEAPRKKSRFKAFLTYLFPVKGDPKKEIIRKIVFLASVLVFCLSSYYLIDYFYESYITDQITKWQQGLYSSSSQTVSGSESSEPVSSVEDDKYPSGMLANFRAVYDENSDTVGWISIPDTETTEINFAVVQSDDNEYYLKHDFLKKDNDHGSIYLDYRNGVKDLDDVSVIYGHNMRDGQMFEALLAYKDINFYKEHPIIQYDTLYKQSQWVIFAAFYSITNPDKGEVFYYNSPLNYDTDEAFMSYVTQIQIRNILDTGIDIQADDKLLVLSTCDYTVDYNTYGGRFVVLARQLREGETAESIDVSGAKLAQNPLKPDIFYETFGGTKPNYSSDGTLITRANTSSNQDSLNASVSESVSTVSSNSSLAQHEQASSEGSASSQQASSQTPSSTGGASSSPSSAADGKDIDSDEELTVKINGKTGTYDAYELLCKIVAAEMGEPFDEEALKAQTIAAHTYIVYYNTYFSGSPPSVVTKTPGSKVKKAVAEVLDKLIYYNGKPAMTVYHSISAGKTVDAKDVWGAHIAYLVSVDSPVDKQVSAYKQTVTYSEEDMAELILDKMGIDLKQSKLDPEDWFEVLNYTSGDYNGAMKVGGETTYRSSGSTVTITGRVLREKILNLRSACFDMDYDGGKFSITTYGYGHGVGMSQQGANQYALEGKDYEWILTHYYTDIEIA